MSFSLLLNALLQTTSCPMCQDISLGLRKEFGLAEWLRRQTWNFLGSINFLGSLAQDRTLQPMTFLLSLSLSLNALSQVSSCPMCQHISLGLRKAKSVGFSRVGSNPVVEDSPFVALIITTRLFTGAVVSYVPRYQLRITKRGRLGRV